MTQTNEARSPFSGSTAISAITPPRPSSPPAGRSPASAAPTSSRSPACASSRATPRASRTCGAAIGDADVVVNALNLPYDQWDKGRMEAQIARVIEAMGTSGKTLLFPGNIYNYAATDRVVTPDLPQQPADAARRDPRARRGAAARPRPRRGDIQVIILRAGDFYGPDSTRRLVRPGDPARGRQGQGRDDGRCPASAMPGPICPISAGLREARLAPQGARRVRELPLRRPLRDARSRWPPRSSAAAPVPLKVAQFPWVHASGSWASSIR